MPEWRSRTSRGGGGRPAGSSAAGAVLATGPAAGRMAGFVAGFTTAAGGRVATRAARMIAVHVRDS